MADVYTYRWAGPEPRSFPSCRIPDGADARPAMFEPGDEVSFGDPVHFENLEPVNQPAQAAAQEAAALSRPETTAVQDAPPVTVPAGTNITDAVATAAADATPAEAAPPEPPADATPPAEPPKE